VPVVSFAIVDLDRAGGNDVLMLVDGRPGRASTSVHRSMER